MVAARTHAHARTPNTHTRGHARARKTTHGRDDRRKHNARSTWRPTFALRERVSVCRAVSLALTRLGGTAAGRGLGGRRRVHCHGKPPLHWNAGRGCYGKGATGSTHTNAARCNTSARANVCVDLACILLLLYFTSTYTPPPALSLCRTVCNRRRRRRTIPPAYAIAAAAAAV